MTIYPNGTKTPVRPQHNIAVKDLTGVLVMPLLRFYYCGFSIAVSFIAVSLLQFLLL